MTITNAVVLWRQRDFVVRGFGDFAQLYTSGKIVQRGLSPRLYDRRLQWEVQQTFAATVTIRRGPLPYVRPPFEALLFVPFSLLRYPVAWAIWTAIKIGVLAGIPLLLRRCCPRNHLFPAGIEWVLCLSSFPIALDLLQGQDSILLLLILVLVYRQLERRSDLLAGLLLGLGLFKFNLIIPVALIFLLMQRFTVVAGFSITAAILSLISWAMIGWHGMLGYVRYLWDLNQMPGAGMAAPQSMPNFRGLLSTPIWKGPIPVSGEWILLSVSFLAIILTARLWRASYRSLQRDAVGFSLSIVVAILTSYHSYSYDMTILLLPLLLLGVASQNGLSKISLNEKLLTGCWLLLLFSPLYWFLARQDRLCFAAVVLTGLAAALAWKMAAERSLHVKDAGIQTLETA
ncbi:MAG: DUF2029 domain-containing protein [Acidobacteriales bacterium]|nr:DUF2029 domain-containing protein [Terriglobales bacterium]